MTGAERCYCGRGGAERCCCGRDEMDACRDCHENHLEGPHLDPRSARPAGRFLPDDCGGGEEDRLSALPDDLLLDILARLRCTRTAALTGLLAHRWRGLWTRLPDLFFHAIEDDRRLLAALYRVTGPVASLVVIVPEYDMHGRPVHRDAGIESFLHDWPDLRRDARIDSLLRAAARLAPVEFSLHVWWSGLAPNTHATELPCFDRATSVELRVPRCRLKLPAAGDFPVLESLYLDCCHIDVAELLRRCSRLRNLSISDRGRGSIALHSQSLEELDVHVHGYVELRRVDIVAPALKKLRFINASGVIDTSSNFSLSLSAPAVEEVSWQCSCHSSPDDRCLVSLTLTAREILSQKQHTTINSESGCEELKHRSSLLSLDICRHYLWRRYGAPQSFGK